MGLWIPEIEDNPSLWAKLDPKRFNGPSKCGTGRGFDSKNRCFGGTGRMCKSKACRTCARYRFGLYIEHFAAMLERGHPTEGGPLEHVYVVTTGISATDDAALRQQIRRCKMRFPFFEYVIVRRNMPLSDGSLIDGTTHVFSTSPLWPDRGRSMMAQDALCLAATEAFALPGPTRMPTFSKGWTFKQRRSLDDYVVLLSPIYSRSKAEKMYQAVQQVLTERYGVTVVIGAKMPPEIPNDVVRAAFDEIIAWDYSTDDE